MALLGALDIIRQHLKESRHLILPSGGLYHSAAIAPIRPQRADPWLKHDLQPHGLGRRGLIGAEAT